MVLEFMLFDEKVERDLKLESFLQYHTSLSNAKEKRGKERM